MQRQQEDPEGLEDVLKVARLLDPSDLILNQVLSADQKARIAELVDDATEQLKPYLDDVFARLETGQVDDETALFLTAGDAYLPALLRLLEHRASAADLTRHLSDIATLDMGLVDVEPRGSATAERLLRLRPQRDRVCAKPSSFDGLRMRVWASSSALSPQAQLTPLLPELSDCAR